jgi:hypothetical protein
MDEKDRYNKPKKINDILKDMNMDPESFKLKQKEEEAKLSTVDAINTLHTKLDILHTQASVLMNDIEEKYTQEKTNLANIKKYITQ